SNNYKWIAICSINLVENLYEQGKNDEALDYYKIALDIASKHDYKSLKLYTSIQTGSILKSKNRLDDALIIYSLALVEAKDLNYYDQQIQIYSFLREVSMLKNDYKSAINYELFRSELKDSINEMQKEKEINELEVKFRTLQKEKEIEVLKVEKTNQILELKNQKEAFKNLELVKELEDRKKENEILILQNSSQRR